MGAADPSVGSIRSGESETARKQIKMQRPSHLQEDQRNSGVIIHNDSTGSRCHGSPLSIFEEIHDLFDAGIYHFQRANGRHLNFSVCVYKACKSIAVMAEMLGYKKVASIPEAACSRYLRRRGDETCCETNRN